MQTIIFQKETINMKNIELQLEALNCPSCVKWIERALNNEKGIENAKVFYQSSKVTATLEESVINIETVTNVLEILGYPVKKIKII